jgi:uncharacterized membrane protein YbhN (UPF0104 family)
VRWLRIVGVAVALAAIGFCAKTLADEWSSVRHSVEHANLGWIAIALCCSAAGMTCLGMLWWACLHVFGDTQRRSHAVAWYFGGELGKYLPGGIWPVVGRGELAQRGGVSRGTAYATTLLSYAVMCVAATIVCGALAPIAAASRGGLGRGWAMVAVVPVGIAAVHPAILGRVLALGQRLTRGRVSLEPPPWSAMLTLIARAIPTWVLIGFASVAVTEALGYNQQPPRVAFAAVAAWILGFVAVPVPAGAGLRELAFVALAGLGSAPGTAVAAIARVLLILVDGIGGLAGLWFARRATANTLSPAEPPADYPDRTRTHS